MTLLAPASISAALAPAFQGYLFAKPMPIDHLAALWERRLARAG